MNRLRIIRPLLQEKGQYGPRCIDYEVKPILQSDEEKELVWCRRTEEAGKNFSQTYVKNAFYFLWIRLL